jgi:amino acid transporter
MIAGRGGSSARSGGPIARDGDHGRGRAADKGLRGGALGLLSSLVIGTSSTAPAYSIAATLGFLVLTGVGTKAVAFILLAFVPIVFVASAFRELNSVEQDCGTNFTWAARAFGGRAGWLTGWVVTVAQLLVMTSQSEITGRYTLLLLHQDRLATDTVATTALGCGWLVALCYLCYRGIEISARVQWFLLGAELSILVVFSVVALVRVCTGGAAPGSLPVSWSWFVPSGVGLDAFVSATLLAVFIYWGWESSLSVNEESADPGRGPGAAAVLSTVLLVGNYLLITVAAVAFAGVGRTGIGLGNEANADDVLAGLGHAVFGTGAAGSVVSTLLIVSVLTSGAAASQATIMPCARTTLSMAHHGALPGFFGRVHPRYRTPVVSTWAFGGVALVLYVGLTALSENVLADSVAAVGLAVAIEYGMTAASCVWVFRRTLTESLRHLLLRGVLPGLGALFFLLVFGAALVRYARPESGATVIAGVGGVAVIGLVSILVGVPLMALVRRFCRDYFAGRVLPRGDVPRGGDAIMVR